MTAHRSPDCHVNKHGSCSGDSWDFLTDEPAPCPCICHDKATREEIIALPTEPGITVYASNVEWECPGCSVSGVGEKSLFAHSMEHVDTTILLTRLKLEGLVIAPGALSLRNEPVVRPPDAGD